MKKICKAKNSSGLKKKLREKVTNCTSNGRAMIIHSMAGLI